MVSAKDEAGKPGRKSVFSQQKRKIYGSQDAGFELMHRYQGTCAISLIVKTEKSDSM